MSSRPRIEKNTYYGLTCNPESDKRTRENIETFRRKCDSFVDYWKPHIPLIFPVPCSEVEETKLTEHIEKVLEK